MVVTRQINSKKKIQVGCLLRKIEVVSSEQQTEDKQSEMLHAVCRSGGTGA